MAKLESQQPLLPSLVDRLIDTEPDVSTEPAWRQAQSLREFEMGVLRDLENLLNTRRVRSDLVGSDGEIARSVLTYGLPELTATGVGSQAERELLRRAVEEAITRFEPRLRQVRATLHEPRNDYDRVLRLTVDGLLWVEPNPLPITFDTIVQPASGQCSVKSR
ncbi:MAG TPA: type VI secretion system baseplate subunit TssE [Pirellulales bacterium]|jgi:type VI secretion system protein ImpF|nr:type VI secretion system baseplate subunit TssE [Pirellulales bacterium]